MLIKLNKNQAEGLADFCFDMAKAGFIGSATVFTVQDNHLLTIITLIISSLTSLGFLIIAIELLKEEYQ